jgi:hypothetical protein
MGKRTAGELNLAPKNCICDPMDLAALGHMLSCPVHPQHEEWKRKRRAA